MNAENIKKENSSTRKMKQDNCRRHGIQLAAVLLQNAHFKGFFTGQIYQGPIKQVCVPGINCYSCPGAVGSCPIGALQNAMSDLRFRFPYYVLGLILFFGALLGRTVCGFLCPFGFLQDLLHRIPLGKKIRGFRGDRPLRKLKYAVLILFVIVLPFFVKLTPFFCKYLCPSGTIAGILLAAADHQLLSVFGSLFMWKLSVLCAIMLTAVVLFRPFCKYLCPLGAIYGIMNRFSLVQLSVDEHKCTGCGRCAAICDMQVDPVKNPCDGECIRCGKCAAACPEEAIHITTHTRADHS